MPDFRQQFKSDTDFSALRAITDWQDVVSIREALGKPQISLQLSQNLAERVLVEFAVIYNSWRIGRHSI